MVKDFVEGGGALAVVGKIIEKVSTKEQKHKEMRVESLLALDGDGGLLEAGGVATGLIGVPEKELNRKTGSLWVVEAGLVFRLDGFDALEWQGELRNAVDRVTILLLVAVDVVLEGKIRDGPVVGVGVVLRLDGGLLPLEVVKGLRPDLCVAQHALAVGSVLDAGLDVLQRQIVLVFSGCIAHHTGGRLDEDGDGMGHGGALDA